ncbi:transient receptor potential cation channel subfamily M member 7-like isoform X1 [Haliotis rufescens]|uniref:transient receptor potential cation channel subfamily M member 7-like isoform X1 n=1 Tax=Haliotis rufescens TaxID=6454 RepID=UPI00201F7A68|nr:transient receptor potential cation channel subfamily M member 7-like isoform X1 [Haliotis rufescens]XP_048248273.1 transient receptor potential cation channel subfamily M member 7-like isoform X1 [Haliotis rufescens]XP_048248274.1 transient receptor potential cation channel subfamily M member 7-like isoform X1 [Haliotis rufescens]
MELPTKQHEGVSSWAKRPAGMNDSPVGVDPIESDTAEVEPWYKKHDAWIQEHVKQRKCFMFSKLSDNVCLCGHYKDDHTDKNDSPKWKKEVNTKTTPTENYGTIYVKTDTDQEFMEGEEDTDNDVSEKHEVQFIRIDEDVSMDYVKYLLFEIWHLTRPKWIFALLGSKPEDTNFNMEYELESALETLLGTSDIWIISDGLHNGVAEFISDLKENERVTSIGCSAWGNFEDVLGAMQVDEKGHRHVGYLLRDDLDDTNSTSLRQFGMTTSHFLLTDNGTRESYLCDLSNLSFQARLIADLAAGGIEGSSAIPTVTILHGGQLIHLEGVRNLIKDNVPIVIAKNTGGMADVLSSAYEESKAVSHNKIERIKNEGQGTVIDERIKKKIKTDLGRTFKSESTDEQVQDIIQCLQRRDLITVVDLNKDMDFLRGILSAVVKSKSDTDLISLVDEYLPSPVFSRNTDEKFAKYAEAKKRSSDNSDAADSDDLIQKILGEALVHEKTECVEFILDYGLVDLEDICLVDQYIETRGDLQKIVGKTFKETKRELEQKLFLDYILKDFERKRIFNRLYGLLERLREILEESKKKSGIEILKCPEDKMKKILVSTVKESKNKDDIRKKVTTILIQCQESDQIDLLKVDLRLLDLMYTQTEATKEFETGASEKIHSKTAGNDEDGADGTEKKEFSSFSRASDTRKEILATFSEKIIQRFVPRSCLLSAGDEAHEQETDETLKMQNVYRQWFLWAVLTNRNDLARVFWKRGKDIVVSALVGGTILSSVAQKTFNNRKKAIREESANLFKAHTIGLMDSCYRDDKDKTVKLLARNKEQNIWNVDFLALAFEKQNLSIFRSEGMTYYTFSKWMGDIPKKTSNWRIVVCTILPFLMWILIGKKTDKTSKLNQHGKGIEDEASKKQSCCGNCKAVFTRFGNFYSTPIVKYILSLVIFCVFLAMYGHLLLVVLTFDYTWNWEIPLLVWMVAFTLEELIQILQFAVERREITRTKKRQKSKTCLERLYSGLHLVRKYTGIYFQDMWNILDSMCIVGFIIGYTLRWFEDTYSYGRVFLSINFMCFFWRLLQACTPSKTIGPMIYMVFRMVADLVPFLVIIFVAIGSYAVATEAILYPNASWSISFVLAIPKKAFWQIFGEFFFEEIGGDACIAPNCPTEIGKTLVPYFLAIYILMTNVLLLNILIALFNNIYEDVRQKADEIWSWQKCRLMVEYESKPPFPLPFTILWRIGNLFKLCGSCKRAQSKKGRPGDDRSAPEEPTNTMVLPDVPDIDTGDDVAVNAEQDATSNGSEAETDAPSTEPVAEEPDAEEPVAEEPDAEEPVAGEPVAGEPVAGEASHEDVNSLVFDEADDENEDTWGLDYDDLDLDLSISTFDFDESDLNFTSSDDDFCLDESDQEDPLDEFERTNADFYIQTENIRR